jgi:protein TIF31
MHHRGINMRYLGVVAKKCDGSLPFLKELCEREMIVRAVKHLLRSILSETDTAHLAPSIAHFLNCFLGACTAKSNNSNSRRAAPKKKKKKAQKGKGPAFALTAASLWSAIQTQTQQRFRYFDISDAHRYNAHPLATLRNLCLKMGIQIAAKDYDFSSEQPFTTEDIIDLFPVVKHSMPKVTLQLLLHSLTH